MWRFIDPTTDFGFKKLFAEENNKEITIGFLNDLLELPAPLTELTFSPSEQLPIAFEKRAGVYDLFCRDEYDNRYLIEMQKHRIPYVKDRLLFYSAFPILSQGQKGNGRRDFEVEYHPRPSFVRQPLAVYETKVKKTKTRRWQFRLDAIYCVAILDYTLPGSTTAVNFGTMRNMRPPHEPYYDKLTFATVELPHFDEDLHDYNLERRINKWLYFFNKATELDEMPAFFKGDKVFEKLFWEAAIANLTEEERWQYEINLKRIRDAEAELSAKYEDGQLNEARHILEVVIRRRFGPLPATILEALRDLNDLERIDDLVEQILEVNDLPTVRKILTAN